MPFIPGTPESLLLRSDSKNPAVTCRGLTQSGRPCRRPISKTPRSSPASSPGQIPIPDGYCHQHKDQAAGAFPQRVQSTTLRERTSLDTLVDRLGLLEVKQKRRENERQKVEQENRPSYTHSSQPLPTKRKSRPKPRSNLMLLCCIGEADVERHPARIPRPHQNRPTTLPTRPHIHRDPSSRTGELLSLIPTSATPQTTALLLAELAKPVSENDDEGYIYMFWLTPESLPASPPSEAATNLLMPPSRQTAGQRRTSDILNTFAVTTPTKKTILLKIGRAQNVQRRLQQWTRQCGYDLSLIRYYPYHLNPSSNSINEVPRTPRKVPCAHKVERLIHIELSGMRPQGSSKCVACGRDHREWFEVDASRDAVKAIDEVIRRWVGWGETGMR